MSDDGQSRGVAEVRWGLLGVLRVESTMSQSDAVDEIMRGRLRGALDEIAIAVTRALAEELERHDAKIVALVHVLGDESIPLTGEP